MIRCLIFFHLAGVGESSFGKMMKYPSLQLIIQRILSWLCRFRTPAMNMISACLLHRLRKQLNPSGSDGSFLGLASPFQTTCISPPVTSVMGTSVSSCLVRITSWFSESSESAVEGSARRSSREGRGGTTLQLGEDGEEVGVVAVHDDLALVRAVQKAGPTSHRGGTTTRCSPPPRRSAARCTPRRSATAGCGCGAGRTRP